VSFETLYAGSQVEEIAPESWIVGRCGEDRALFVHPKFRGWAGSLILEAAESRRWSRFGRFEMEYLTGVRLSLKICE